MGHGSAPKCGGTNRQGDPCGNPAGKGTDHYGSGNCSSHAGSTPTGRAAALNERAERLLYQRDAPPVTDPLSALQRLAGRAAAWEDIIGEKVNELRSLRYSTEGGEQLRAEIVVMERAMDRVGKLLVDIAKLNIEDRLAGVREATARMLDEALAAALQKSGADPSGQDAAREEFKRRLRIVG
jgi:hypothetical protein